MLLIFDWDGTLCDSADKIIYSMQQAAESLGLPVLASEPIRNIIGLALPEALALLYPDVAPRDREAISAEYSRHFIASDDFPAPLFPSVADTLEQLKSHGHTLTVATGKSRKGLNRVLAKLGLSDFFDSTRCADETASKPHPLMLFELLQEFGALAQNAVMVGDTEYDMEMAVRAEMPRIAVSYGAHELHRLQVFDPALCIDRLDEMLSWIDAEDRRQSAWQLTAS